MANARFAWGIDIGNRHDVAVSARFSQQPLAAIAHTNCAHANAIARRRFLRLRGSGEPVRHYRGRHGGGGGRL